MGYMCGGRGAAPIRCVVTILLSVFVMLIVPAAAWTSGPLTVSNRWHVQPQALAGNDSEITLAGIGTAVHGEPALVSVVWARDPTSWLGTWNVELRSDAHIFGTTSKSHVLRSGLLPKANQEIEAVLSYDGQNGLVSVRVTDLKTREVLVHAHLAVDPIAEELHPWTVGTGSQPGLVPLDGTVSRAFVPVGLRTRLVDWPAGSPFLYAYVDRSQNPRLALKVDGDTARIPLQFVVRAQPANIEIARFTSTGTAVPFATATLPVGAVRLEVRYVDSGGNEWVVDSHATTIGAVTAGLHDVVFTRAPNEPVRLTGTIRLEADGQLPEIHLAAEVCFAKWYWYNGQLQQSDETVHLGEYVVAAPAGTPVQFPVALDVPDLTYGAPWLVAFHPVVRVTGDPEVLIKAPPSLHPPHRPIHWARTRRCVAICKTGWRQTDEEHVTCQAMEPGGTAQ